jgi:hypothetical protein
LCCVHDTIVFEQRGIPGAVIITEAFTKAAEFQLRAKGMPGHPAVVLPHPISNLSPADMQTSSHGVSRHILVKKQTGCCAVLSPLKFLPPLTVFQHAIFCALFSRSRSCYHHSR